MHQLLEAMTARIAAGLQRKSLTTCSRWASACRIMGNPFPGKWTFKWHPWLKDMHDSEARFNVGQKAAQMGFTELALNRVFYSIDVKGVDCLYVLPAKTPDASDFSAARFDPALELSPHLANLFSDVKNVGHKRAGTANLYIRGSRSRSSLKSVPVGLIILDEVDEMNQRNIPLVLERTSGQLSYMDWVLSTPTVPNIGINKFFKTSTQEHFHFKCPHCSKWTELSFPECLVITGEDLNDPELNESYYQCKECSGLLEHETKHEWLKDGKWIEAHGDRDIRGFGINQMYSSAEAGSAPLMAQAFMRSQRDPTEEQEFYNSKLGKEHIVSEAQLTDEIINRNIGQYKKGTVVRGLITMGIDVGRQLHYEILQWWPGQTIGVDLNTDATCRVMDMGKALHFEELDALMIKWGVAHAIIDSQPERRAALQFANRFYGRVNLCTYAQGITGKVIHVSKDEELTVNVDRTSWLDLSLGRFRRENAISIPFDTPYEYKEHLKALVRIYKKDKNGNPVGRYENGDNDDHYAHAHNYAEIALPLAARSANPVSIRSPV